MPKAERNCCSHRFRKCGAPALSIYRLFIGCSWFDFWVYLGTFLGTTFKIDSLHITVEILALVAEIDEFKGAWRALGTLAPERLSALRRVATIESIGSSTRIEGSKLTDAEVERLLANLDIKSFESRDEQEVVGYAQVMEMVFAHFDAIDLTENHVTQLHRDLMVYSNKDERHGGAYKTLANNVSAIATEKRLASSSKRRRLSKRQSG